VTPLAPAATRSTLGGPARPVVDRVAELHGYAAARHTELFSLVYLLTGDWDRAAGVVERALADGYRRGDLDHATVRRRAVRLALRRRPRARPDPGDDPLWTAVCGLRARERAALALSVHAGLRPAEIADILDRSEGSVHSLLDRARRRLSR
jgi:DNA-directed RNA polymerase specialized sigma24 family protein